MNHEKIRKALDKPMEIALYLSLEYGNIAVWERRMVNHDKHYNELPNGETREHPMTGFVRISEPITVSWTQTDEETMVQNAMGALDLEVQKIRTEMQAKLDQLEERRSQLLAITHQPA